MKEKVTKYIRTISLAELDGLNKKEALDFFRENMLDGSKLDLSYGENYISVLFEREETDEEYESRMGIENRRKEEIKQKELETLRQLKEKYEK